MSKNKVDGEDTGAVDSPPSSYTIVCTCVYGGFFSVFYDSSINCCIPDCGILALQIIARHSYFDNWAIALTAPTLSTQSGSPA